MSWLFLVLAFALMVISLALMPITWWFFLPLGLGEIFILLGAWLQSRHNPAG